MGICNNICGISRSSTAITTYGDKRIGRHDSLTRVVRYNLDLPENIPIYKINFKFSSSKFGYTNWDARTTIGAYISTVWNDVYSTSGVYSPPSGSIGTGTLEFKEGKTIVEGTIEFEEPLIPQPNTNYYVFLYSPHYTGTKWGYIDWGTPVDESEYESYTIPSAPTNFVFKDYILSTGFTVEWNKPQSSDNNPITGYELFLKDKSIGTVEGESITSYSYKFPKDQNFQGEDITVSIRTIGTADSAKYSEMKKISGRVNTRPPEPTLRKNYSGNGFYEKGTVIITILNSQKVDEDNDPISYQYKTDKDEGWVDVTTDLKVEQELTETTTFYFRTYDNKEYSDETSLIIKKYTLSITEENIIKGDYGVEEITYYVTGNCQVRALYEDGEDKKTKTFDFNNGNNTINLITELGFSQTEIKLTFYPKDDNGTVLDLGDNGFQTKEIEKTPAMPTQKDIQVFDSHNDNGVNVINNSEYHCFFKEITIKVPKFDYRIENFDKTIIFGDKNKGIDNFVKKDNFYLLKATFDAAQETTEENLSLKLGDYVFDLGGYYRVINFPFTNIKSTFTATPIIYDSKKAEVTFLKPTDTQLKQNYGIITPNWKVSIEYNNYGTTPIDCSDSNDPSTSINSYKLSWEINEDTLTALKINRKDYSEKKNFTLRVSTTNAYGASSTKTCEQLYDFDKNPVLEVVSLQYNKKDNNNNDIWATPETDFRFVEGMNIKIVYKITKWQAETIAFEIQTNKGKTTLFSFNDTSGNSLSGLESSEISKEFEIPKITKTETWNLCLYNDKVAHSVGTAYSTLPLEDKKVTIDGFTYSNKEYILKNEKIEPALESEGNYYSVTSYLVIDGSEEELVNNKVTPEVDPMEGKDSLVGFLRIEQKITVAGYSITKSWDSNTVVIYNIVPTISYRKNRVGINTSNPEADDSILYVARAGDGHNITFKVVDDEGNSNNIVIDLKTGNFTGTGGLLSSFIIDCGSWDDTPSGPIPSVPGAPSGLARIAYTGLISDLVEDENIDLILDANEFDFS